MGRDTMKRALTAVVLSVGLIVGLASAASADDKEKDKPKTYKVEPFRVEPFQFGLGALVGWIRGAGAPGQKHDEGQFGLYLQKHTPDSTTYFAAAGAELTGNVPKTAQDLTTLAFDISGFPDQEFDSANFGTVAGSTHGYCGAGAPRFNVFSASGTTFLGCAAGDKTQDSVTGWWTVKFVPPFARYGGGPEPDGTIAGIEIVFDERTNLGGGRTVGSSPGDVGVDNIPVNDKGGRKATADEQKL